MMTVRRLLVPFLCLTFLAASPAFAQSSGAQHVVSPQQLAATVDNHVVNQDADRAAIHQALKRADVQNVAATMHVDLERAQAVVDTMTGADLAQAASAARQINSNDLVGGASTIVISTTTIIIVLLVLILLIVALR